MKNHQYMAMKDASQILTRNMSKKEKQLLPIKNSTVSFKIVLKNYL